MVVGKAGHLHAGGGEDLGVGGGAQEPEGPLGGLGHRHQILPVGEDRLAVDHGDVVLVENGRHLLKEVGVLVVGGIPVEAVFLEGALVGGDGAVPHEGHGHRGPLRQAREGRRERPKEHEKG